MTWKHVFNTNHKMWHDRDDARKGALQAGYKFFAFNGGIYWCADDSDTGLKVSDIEAK